MNLEKTRTLISKRLSDDELYFEVWGPFAAFTRPEFHVERISYDVITPSAARNIAQQLYWHPSFDYIVEKIAVFNPIQHMGMTKNELQNGVIGKRGEIISRAAMRQQRYSDYLRNVHYGVRLKVVEKPGNTQEFNLGKIRAKFVKARDNGHMFHVPYLGLKECTANVAQYKPSFDSDRELPTTDLGIMLLDVNYDVAPAKPLFFHPIMRDGIIEVPDRREVAG